MSEFLISLELKYVGANPLQHLYTTVTYCRFTNFSIVSYYHCGSHEMEVASTAQHYEEEPRASNEDFDED